MNRTLSARTRPEFYDLWVKTAREGGLPEDEIQQYIAGEIRKAQALLDGKCPKCGAPSTRYVDYKRQQGSSAVRGAWVQYRCSKQPPPGTLRPPNVCDFAEDLLESEASN